MGPLTDEMERELLGGTLTATQAQEQVSQRATFTGTFIVIESREGVTITAVGKPTLSEAIELALEWGDENQLIRPDEAGDDFMGTHTTYTRDELRLQLLRIGEYEDGDCKVEIKPDSRKG